MEVRLPKDTAYFITRTWWYNNSPVEQAYYQWSNAGVKASGNLEYIFPGTSRIGHDGAVLQWPKDEENNQINLYDKNDFGEYKSYHVFGTNTDFWGCYWHDDNFGMGHYSPYSDKPGKKIWIWGLSRFGMIWEDLLTDNDGQYTEVQSGRMFNQSIAASSKTPFKHRSFLPYTFDSWDEYWFPVKQTEGITYACPQLSFNIQKEQQCYSLRICANETLQQTVEVHDHTKRLLLQQLDLHAMETATFLLPEDSDVTTITILVNEVVLYDAAELQQPLKRPTVIAKGFDHESVQGLCIQAKEWERQRFFFWATEKYIACLQKDPYYLPALKGYATMLFRQLDYSKAMELVKTALSIDTYEPEANFLYGLLNNRLGNTIDAEDGFSIATQSTAYRAAAYTELSKIYIRKKQLNKAANCLDKALQYNTNNRQALQLQVVTERLQGGYENALNKAANVLLFDPLDHICRYEQRLLNCITDQEFQQHITSELDYETYIEIAAFYFGLHLYNDADKVLQLSSQYAMVTLWRAFLQPKMNNKEPGDQLLEEAALCDPFLVFPHRQEDIQILLWAIEKHESWKFRYYLALTYSQLLKKAEALQLLEICGDEPDYYPFYIVRANLRKELLREGREEDLVLAKKHGPKQWRTYLLLSKYYAEKGDWQKALSTVQQGYEQDKSNYYLGLHLAKYLLYTNQFDEGISLMNDLNVLPNEGAFDGRIIWRETHLQAALNSIKASEWNKAAEFVSQARVWPENLGVGKPYQTDERLEDFIAVICKQQLNSSTSSLIKNIVSYRDTHKSVPYSSRDTITILVLRAIDDCGKAEAILSNWLEKEPNSLAGRWTKAFVDNNLDDLAVLNKERIEVKEPLPYEIVLEDRDFDFVKSLYSTHILNNALDSIKNNNFNLNLYNSKI